MNYKEICEKYGLETLVGANLTGADLRIADLRCADLTGADLRRADLGNADLTEADLTGADLRRADLGDADLRCADLRCADLTGADLTGADLTGADLRCADLRCTDLTGADLRDAHLRKANLSNALIKGCKIDLNGVPVIPDIHRRLYEVISQKGNTLDMCQWHTCDTTHCRAGWVVILAGEEGKKLEDKFGSSSLAAFLIYMASDPSLEKIPNFYVNDQEAIDDIKKMAGVSVP